VRTIGRIAIVVVAAAVAGFGVLAVKSIPDIRRYLSIRRM
jgi:Family of unknown function (DUF6893)